MEVFSTQPLPRRAKLDYWNEVSSRTFTRLEVAPSDRAEFEGSLWIDAIGPLTLAKVSSSAVKIRRTESDALVHRDSFQVQLAVEGSFLVSQAGCEVVLDEGDFHVSDPTLPLHIAYDRPCTAIIVIVPAALMRQHLPFPERLVGLQMPRAVGINRVPSTLIRVLWEQLHHGTPPEVSQRLADNLLDTLAVSYVAAHGVAAASSAAADWRLFNIKRFIESHLGDPDLTPRKVAEAMRISPRYMRELFAKENDTVSAYILRARLEKCACHIKDAWLRGQTITDVALRWGFNNPTHFSRSFKAQYGMTAREYRRTNDRSIPPPSR